MNFVENWKKKPQKTVEHESDGDNNYNWCSWYSHEKIGVGGLRNKRTSTDHLNYNISKICQKTEKSLGDLRKFADSQSPERNHY